MFNGGDLLGPSWCGRIYRAAIVELPILGAIPSQVGYDSQASFSRAFKRVIGEPPSHFRDDAQGKGLFSSPLS